MPRKTGEDSLIQVEVGALLHNMSALATVSSPAADVGKKFVTAAEFISGQESLEPIVRLDGVISGFTLSVGSGYNEIDYTAGKAYIKGALVEVVAGSVSNIPRPLISGNVLVSAITLDGDGNVDITTGAEGTTSTTRGAAGGPPFIPIDKILLGYITATYYGGSESGASLVQTAEIDSETKEYTFVPSYEVLYHDITTALGCIQFASALPLIHGVTDAGPGTARRNVYVQYSEPQFEQMPEAFDFSFDEDISTIKSKAYGQNYEETRTSTPSWTGRGSAYWTKVNDILSLVKNKIRWIKYFPDKDETDYFAGRAVWKVSREMPVEGNLMASVTLEGAGEIYDKS